MHGYDNEPRRRRWFTAEKRREIILTAAREIIRSEGSEGITCDEVARRCSVATSPSLVKFYYRNADGIREALKT